MKTNAGEKKCPYGSMCLHGKTTAKKALLSLSHEWLTTEEIEATHKMGEDPKVRERDAYKELRRLEETIRVSHDRWQSDREVSA